MPVIAAAFIGPRAVVPSLPPNGRHADGRTLSCAAQWETADSIVAPRRALAAAEPKGRRKGQAPAACGLSGRSTRCGKEVSTFLSDIEAA